METRLACPRNPRESIQTERQLLSIPANPEAKLSFDRKFQFSVLRLFPMQIQNNFRIRKLQKACSGCRYLRNHLWETPAWTSCLLYFLQGGISHLHVPDMPFIAKEEIMVHAFAETRSRQTEPGTHHRDHKALLQSLKLQTFLCLTGLQSPSL